MYSCVKLPNWRVSAGTRKNKAALIAPNAKNELVCLYSRLRITSRVYFRDNCEIARKLPLPDSIGVVNSGKSPHREGIPWNDVIVLIK